jgi:hypothetical protein
MLTSRRPDATRSSGKAVAATGHRLPNRMTTPAPMRRLFWWSFDPLLNLASFQRESNQRQKGGRSSLFDQPPCG